MKHFLILIFTSLSSFAISQDAILEKDVVLKKGIYTTQSEFWENSPDKPLNFPLDTIITKFDGGSLMTFRINFDALSKEEYNKIKTQKIWGFCDGTNVYVNTSYTSYGATFNASKHAEFAKLEHIGKYCIFRKFEQYHGASSALSEARSYYFIKYAESAKMLTKASLKKEVKSDPDFYAKVKKAKGLYGLILENYLISFDRKTRFNKY